MQQEHKEGCYCVFLCTVLYDINPSTDKERTVSVDQVSCGTGKKQEGVQGENQWFRIRSHGRNQSLLQVTGLSQDISNDDERHINNIHQQQL